MKNLLLQEKYGIFDIDRYTYAALDFYRAA
jgi:hypothetical protein